MEPVFSQLLPGANLSFLMISIEGGTFLMGSEDPEARDREKPVHTVAVPSFYMAKYPVTQALWKAVMGNNPSYFQGDQRPVEQVSWDDAQAFIQQLNEQTGENYRLPTEAEWEYAARGGIYGQGFKYAGSNKLKEVGWYDGNSHGETKPVGLKFLNELGLYDMSGNVWEWCQDVWHENYDGAPKDGSAWLKGGNDRIRVVRGGAWNNVTEVCRVAYRYWDVLDSRFLNVGFRFAQ